MNKSYTILLDLDNSLFDTTSFVKKYNLFSTRDNTPYFPFQVSGDVKHDINLVNLFKSLPLNRLDVNNRVITFINVLKNVEINVITGRSLSNVDKAYINEVLGNQVINFHDELNFTQKMVYIEEYFYNNSNEIIVIDDLTPLEAFCRDLSDDNKLCYYVYPMLHKINGYAKRVIMKQIKIYPHLKYNAFLYQDLSLIEKI